MNNISISEEILEKCPKIRLGVISANIIIQSENKELWDKIILESRMISDKYSELPKMETILTARAAYKALGKDPSRYRPSAEALLRRIISGKELYSVNNVVNLINLISFTSGFSIGGYDADSINGEITLERGLASDYYEGLGRGQLNIENLPILRDLTGAFGCPTSDSERTGIRSETKNCLWVFFDFGSNPVLEKYLKESIELLQEFADAKNIATQIFRNS
jgi:DNA/RNA-binding domain of Phe-tRNA-synthetase-like protein